MYSIHFWWLQISSWEEFKNSWETIRPLGWPLTMRHDGNNVPHAITVTLFGFNICSCSLQVQHPFSFIKQRSLIRIQNEVMMYMWPSPLCCIYDSKSIWHWLLWMSLWLFYPHAVQILGLIWLLMKDAAEAVCLSDNLSLIIQQIICDGTKNSWYFLKVVVLNLFFAASLFLMNNVIHC